MRRPERNHVDACESRGSWPTIASTFSRAPGEPVGELLGLAVGLEHGGLLEAEPAVGFRHDLGGLDGAHERARDERVERGHELAQTPRAAAQLLAPVLAEPARRVAAVRAVRLGLAMANDEEIHRALRSGHDRG